MKNRIFRLSALLLSVLLLFSSCYSVTKKKPTGKARQVSRVLIYALDREDAITEPDSAELPEPYTLPQEQVPDFFRDLSRQSYASSILYEPDDPNFVYYGHVVKLEYDNGAEEWLSGVHMTLYIEPDGLRQVDHYTPDEESWENLIAEYLPNTDDTTGR